MDNTIRGATPPHISSSATTSSPVSIKDARLQLNQWARAGGPGENRADAKKAVMDFMQNGGVNEFGEGSNQLNLKGMGLTSLPPHLDVFAFRASGLNLQGNKLTTLEGAEKMPFLNDIDASHNALQDSTSLAGFDHLKQLNVQGNALGELFGMKNLSGLESLNVSHNQLSSLAGMPETGNLNQLDVSHNHLIGLASMPPQSGLTSLNLGSNAVSNLRGLPPLPALQEIDVSGNPLAGNHLNFLPGNVHTVRADNCELTQLHGLENCSRMKSLSLSGNPGLTAQAFAAFPQLKPSDKDGTYKIHSSENQKPPSNDGPQDFIDVLRMSNAEREKAGIKSYFKFGI
ncbi:leucine-rich repeat domain-containing protein [Enterobacter hormaechei]|uniref:leucine-rich repeat domain-containing protein n=1 Tax=Enterobacter hormaechei TaxID=158836 RepID=UPI00390806B2